jgi:toxin ParE1/3/4
MIVIILPEATAELLLSARWYNEQRLNLGNRLIADAWAVVDRIPATPRAFRRYEFYQGPEDIRRAGLPRFPFGVIYLVEPQCIAIVAFAPDKREPFYWQDRLRNIGI